ncbi:hypothetical protein E0H73_34575 [Kribbella pittospori]|uniref:Uncharacterized protein n=1 Tax=Kribbella pittospori TaxID=722689 RepID=A0A4R0K980_9ACTN|nr:hypothetical protein [Kribbella pittospori]TCC55857.1 hypothetical protein E0H73_34575 [Kribbella pittospori]
MLWLYISLGVVGIGIAGWIAWRQHLRLQQSAELLESLRAMVTDDVARFGEQYRQLPAGDSADYAEAGVAYSSALEASRDLRNPAAAGAITQTLADAQYAVLRYTATIAGQPVPERRVPCFFDPQHGPSVADVLWTEPGRGTRKLPACADDAARITAGTEPSIRYAEQGGHRVPYWDAGPGFAPYGAGYFSRAASSQQFVHTNFGGQDNLEYGNPRHFTGRSPYPLEPRN